MLNVIISHPHVLIVRCELIILQQSSVERTDLIECRKYDVIRVRVIFLFVSLAIFNLVLSFYLIRYEYLHAEHPFEGYLAHGGNGTSLKTAFQVTPSAILLHGRL